MAVRAVRGAVQLSADDPDEMRDAVVELLTAMIERNGLTLDDLISMVFTSTPDLRSEFPATAARALDIGDALEFIGMPRGRNVSSKAQRYWPAGERVHIQVRALDGTNPPPRN